MNKKLRIFPVAGAIETYNRETNESTLIGFIEATDDSIESKWRFRRAEVAGLNLQFSTFEKALRSLENRYKENLQFRPLKVGAFDASNNLVGTFKSSQCWEAIEPVETSQF